MNQDTQMQSDIIQSELIEEQIFLSQALNFWKPVYFSLILRVGYPKKYQ